MDIPTGHKWDAIYGRNLAYPEKFLFISVFEVPSSTSCPFLSLASFDANTYLTIVGGSNLTIVGGSIVDQLSHMPLKHLRI